MSLSKRTRFSIFERDSFTCQYCGSKPPDVVLHVDHMISKKNGGGDETENLITACISCNLGKSAKSINRKVVTGVGYKQDIKQLKEKKEQLEGYYEFIKQKELYELEEINIFQKRWRDCSDHQNSLTDKGLKDIRNLLKTYTTEQILEAIRIAFDNERVESNGKFRYMCGVLKNLKLKQTSPDEYSNKLQRMELTRRLTQYWKGQPKGSGYLPTHWLDNKIDVFNESTWKEIMDEARGYWNDLEERFNSYSTL